MKKRYASLIALLFIAIPVYGDSYTDGSIGFLSNEEEKPILNPNNPNEKITVIDTLDKNHTYSAGEKGVLTIDYVSNFQLGEVRATSQTDIVKAKEQEALTQSNRQVTVPNFIQVTDTRGTNSGWQLSVKQQIQFRTKSQTYPELTGAILQLRNGRHTSPVANDIWINENLDLTLGQEVIVMKAKAGENSGTNLYAWENQGVHLLIPGNSPKLAQTYQTTLLWSISDTPN
jgi:hypothetical protein